MISQRLRYNMDDNNALNNTEMPWTKTKLQLGEKPSTVIDLQGKVQRRCNASTTRMTHYRCTHDKFASINSNQSVFARANFLSNTGYTSFTWLMWTCTKLTNLPYGSLFSSTWNISQHLHTKMTGTFYNKWQFVFRITNFLQNEILEIVRYWTKYWGVAASYASHTHLYSSYT